MQIEPEALRSYWNQRARWLMTPRELEDANKRISVDSPMTNEVKNLLVSAAASCSTEKKRSFEASEDTKPLTPVLFSKPDKPFGQLSNFWPLAVPMKFRGKTYATSEHAYQACKFLFEGASDANITLSDIIRTQNTPYKAKILTLANPPKRYPWQQALAATVVQYRQLGAAPRSDWYQVKKQEMFDVLMVKFTTDLKCQNALLSTGTRTLVEHSKTDTFWADGGDGRGQNQLGALLEQVRSNLTDAKRHRTNDK